MAEIYGTNPVLEELRSGGHVRRIYMIEDPNEKQRQLLQLAQAEGVFVESLRRDHFRQRFGPHAQGVVALVDDWKPIELRLFLEELRAGPGSIVLLLDEIQDPQNLGALLRTAEAAGVEGVVTSLRRSASFTPVVFKASSGAIAHLRICQAPSLNWMIEQLKEKGYWLVGTDSHKGADLYSGTVQFPLALILGSEGWGVRPLLLKRCDFLLKIPMFGKINSLNVSVAGGILLYEIRRRLQQL